MAPSEPLSVATGCACHQGSSHWGGFLHWLLLQLVLLIGKSRLLKNEGLFCPLCYHCDLCQYPQEAKSKVVWTILVIKLICLLSECYKLVTRWTGCSEDVLELWLFEVEHSGWHFVPAQTAGCCYIVLGRLHASGPLKKKNLRSFRHTLTQLLECQEFVSSWLAVVYTGRLAKFTLLSLIEM